MRISSLSREPFLYLIDGSWISYLGGTEEDHILFDYMRLNSMKHILPLVLLLLLQPHPSHSHNGAVAIAVPVEGITVDGDLSDWPEGMREYDIELYESGDAPRDSSDILAVIPTTISLISPIYPPLISKKTTSYLQFDGFGLLQFIVKSSLISTVLSYLGGE